MNDPWGLDQPPAGVVTTPLPPRLAELSQVQATGTPLTEIDPDAIAFPATELPEVQSLIR